MFHQYKSKGGDEIDQNSYVNRATAEMVAAPITKMTTKIAVPKTSRMQISKLHRCTHILASDL